MIIRTQKTNTRPNGNTEKTHCFNGHEFNEENTYINPKSRKRNCRICNAARIHRHWAEDVDGTRRKGREHMQTWRSENRERDRQNWTIRRRRTKEWLDSHKTPCIQCSESDPACLDLHHRDSSKKEATLSIAVAHWSINKLQKEMEKCDILCSNCHRKLHAAEKAAFRISK